MKTHEAIENEKKACDSSEAPPAKRTNEFGSRDSRERTVRRQPAGNARRATREESIRNSLLAPVPMLAWWASCF